MVEGSALHVRMLRSREVGVGAIGAFGFHGGVSDGRFIEPRMK